MENESTIRNNSDNEALEKDLKQRKKDGLLKEPEPEKIVKKESPIEKAAREEQEKADLERAQKELMDHEVGNKNPYSSEKFNEDKG